MHQAKNVTANVVHDKVGQYSRPYRKYGRPLTPGTARDGSGHLDVILEYRPTHIVHLAGTQSDSLLSANYHAQGGDVSPSRRNSIFQNKDEEEDNILRESISSCPHLYDLRMGVTGITQLLRGAGAQTMIPPRVGPASAVTAHLSESNLARKREPHIVYASSSDAIYFRDITARLKENVRKGLEHETLGNISLPLRGIHGMSRLVDEILASSYHA